MSRREPRTRSTPFSYLEGRILLQLSDAYRKRGEPDRARERLEEALAIFRRLGAQPDIERAERALAML